LMNCFVAASCTVMSLPSVNPVLLLSMGKFFPTSMLVVLAMTVSEVVELSPDLPG